MRKKHRKLRKLLSLDGYATSPVWIQLLVLVILSTACILAFSLVLGPVKKSFFVFFDAEGFTQTSGPWATLLGLVEFIIGFTIAGFVISLLTTALEIFIADIKAGTLPYRKSDHIIIVNDNPKLLHILHEINTKYEEIKEYKDVVVLVNSKERVARLLAKVSLIRFSSINLYVKQGDPLHLESFNKITFRKAFGILILLDQDTPATYAGDNYNLQIVTTLMNDAQFAQTLVERDKALTPMKCLVETRGTIRSKDIARFLTTVDDRQFFAVVDPQDFISKIISRSLVNPWHFQIYSEIFRFQGHEIFFIDPAQAAPGQDLAGKSFEELNLRFDRGCLLGFSTPGKSGLEIRLAPLGQPLGKSDWLVFLADNESAVHYAPGPPSPGLPPPGLPPIAQPSEIERRRICMIGDALNLEHLFEFLDEESHESFEEVVLPTPLAYFDEHFLRSIEERDFDNVIINLDDEVSFKLVLYIVSLYGRGHPFLKRMVTVVESPVVNHMLRQNVGEDSFISSVELSAYFMTQIVFQKNLVSILEELIQAKGWEFNLLAATPDLAASGPEAMLRLRRRLLDNAMIYTGVITRDGRLVFESESTEQAEHLVILSRGVR